MSEATMIAIAGDPSYSNLVAIDWLNSMCWSRKRKRKWLRRQGHWCNRARVAKWDRQAIDWNDDDDGAPEWCDTCSNSGIVNCFCGGDLCVCMNYGEMPCPNCS